MGKIAEISEKGAYFSTFNFGSVRLSEQDKILPARGKNRAYLNDMVKIFNGIYALHGGEQAQASLVLGPVATQGFRVVSAR